MPKSHRIKTAIFKPIFKFFLALLLLFVFAKNSFAQDEIIVKGVDRVEESTITQYFEL